VLEYCARSELHPRSGLRVLTRRIKIVLVLPPSPKSLLWSAPRFLFRQACHPWSAASLARPTLRACQGRGVWLRKTSREADFERVTAQSVGIRRANCPRRRPSASASVLVERRRSREHDFDAPFQHPQPRGREVQFRLGAVLQHSRTPSLRVAGFEDEDDDEDENEAPCEGGAGFGRFPGLKPWAVLLNHFMVSCPAYSKAAQGTGRPEPYALSPSATNCSAVSEGIRAPLDR